MDSDHVREILFRGRGRRRFAQETPILPEAWFALAEAPEARHDLLITPQTTLSANALLRDLLEGLGDHAIAAEPIALRGFVAVSLTFAEVVDLILPRTRWARTELGRADDAAPAGRSSTDDDNVLHLIVAVERERRRRLAEQEGAGQRPLPGFDDAAMVARDLRARLEKRLEAKPSIWRVALNRALDLSDEESRTTVKADAAFRVFDVRCSKVTWAVVDSGIDVNHPAFRGADGKSRVRKAFDFTGLRALLNAGYRADPAANPQLKIACAAADIPFQEGAELLQAAHRGLDTDTMDWSSIEPLIRLADPPMPTDGHGTHVAGIIGADWREPDGTPIVVGLCPDISLYDLRILSRDTHSTELAVIAALQFIRFLNARNQFIAVQGVNLSLSIPHRVENYACGRTPVCDECERLVGAGVTVVAAAGNNGYQGYATTGGVFEGYATLSITDPGNAEAVITVGSTHKREPHTYGVSYFSSRGPTGDGRAKPDLVAPGERIRSTLPDGEYGPLDGTSQAAPHVSAAAALLMARFPELIGQPARIKALLCESAMDLGRERAFQGHGLLDVLRALQSF